MAMNASRSMLKDFLIALVGAAAGFGWRELFGWWSRRPAQTLYEQVVRHFDVSDVMTVMGTDLLFAIACGLLAAELFIRLARPDRYRPEAIVVVAFLAAIFAAAQIGDGGISFLMHLPPLWLTLLCFGIRVGYGIKAKRKQLAAAG